MKVMGLYPDDDYVNPNVFGLCEVTPEGSIYVHHPDKDFTYPIPYTDLLYDDWVQHMSCKRWVNIMDFYRAYIRAIEVTGQKDKARSKAATCAEWLKENGLWETPPK